MSVDYTALGKKIKECRLSQGLTQEQLAEKCELSASFLGHIERGTRKLSVETLCCIADMLNVSLDFLLSESVHTHLSRCSYLETSLAKMDKPKTDILWKIIRIMIEHADQL